MKRAIVFGIVLILAFLFIAFFFVLAFYLGPAITGFTVLSHTSSSDFTGTFNQETDNINLLISSENYASMVR